MQIVACIKQVPDTTQVQIDPVTNTLVREGLAPGVDRALLLSSRVFVGADTLSTSNVLAAALCKLASEDEIGR